MNQGYARFFTGGFWLWWPFPHGEGITLKGDPTAVSRTDPRWREQWKWVILAASFSSTTSPPRFSTLFFRSEEFSKRYMRSIKEQLIGVRLGSGDVTFIAMRRIYGTLIEIPLRIVCGPGSQEELEAKLSLQGISETDIKWI